MKVLIGTVAECRSYARRNGLGRADVVMLPAEGGRALMGRRFAMSDIIYLADASIAMRACGRWDQIHADLMTRVVPDFDADV